MSSVDEPLSLSTALTLAFADSEVACVSAASDGVRIRLSAAQVRRSAAAGGLWGERSAEAGAEQPVEGFSRGVELRLPGARLTEPAGHFIGRVSSGRVRRGGYWSCGLPLPFSSLRQDESSDDGSADRDASAPRQAAPEITLELGFANRSQLVLVATGIECRFEGEANFSESLFC